MGKFVCLMGKSSSGKDTIYKRLLDMPDLHLERIVPYTTRPIRQGEQEGVEYHFTDEAGYNTLMESGRVIEARAYNTTAGIWRYFTVTSDDIDLVHNSYLNIGTLEACEKIIAFFGVENVLPIMIYVDDGIRLQRALSREMSQTNPRYAELCRRFLADEEDFASENLYKAGDTLKSFENKDLEHCVQEIKDYIKRNVEDN